MVGVDWEMSVLADLSPMPFLHARVAEDSDEGNKLKIILDLIGQPV